MTTFKKLFAALLFISVAISARADGEHQHPEINIYDYQIETVELDGQTYQRAVVTKDHDHSRHMTFEEVLGALASAGIKYVICPEGLTPEQFQAAKDKKSFYAVVAKENICEPGDGWVYYYASEPDSAMIYTGTPKEVNGETAKGVVTVSTKLNIDRAEYKYKLNGQPFTGKLFHDEKGNLFGVEDFDVNKQVNLAYKEAFTYVDKTTDKRVKYNYGVVSKEDGFYGVLNPTCVIKLDYVDKLLKYTHTVGSETYAYLEEVYGMAYSKDNAENHIAPNGVKVYGKIGGTEVELTHNDSPTFVDLYQKGNYLAIYNKEKDGDIYVFKGYLHEMEEYGHDTQHYTYCTNLEGHVHTDSLWKGEILIVGGEKVKLDFGWQYVTADENGDGIYADLYDGYVCVDHDRYSDDTLVSHHAHGYNADKSVFKEIEATITYSYYNRFTGHKEIFTGHKESHYHEYLPIDFTVDLKKIPNAPVPTGKFHLYADVKTPMDNTTNKLTAPGQLRKALHSWEELGNPNNRWWFNVPNVTRLTLSGVVCFADIADMSNLTENGHAMIYDGNVMKQSDGKMDIKEVTDSKGNKYYVDDPSGEAAWNYPYVSKGIIGMTGAKLEYLDLTDAVFPVQTDLNISLSQPGVKKVLLPTSKEMWLIPDGAFNNCHYIEELCIPHNYKKIGSRAFYNTHALRHIYTTSDPNNSDDEFVDNGPNTFTFASTLKEIEGGVSGAEATFFGSQMDNVTDIYVLATVAPKCGANAFSAAMTYGNNGFAGNWVHPIRRENYNNNDKWICVLHYPTDCEESQAKNYTDITRKYTLNDEVGDVDGTGKPMVWPRHAEFFRAYNQAVNGVTWGAWQEYPTTGWTQEVIRTLEEAQKYNIDNTKNYDQAYQGWHEFVLTGNSNSMEIDVQKETVFVQRDWYTLCVPYDLKKSQMLELFGIDVTKSANNKVKMLGATGYTDVTETMYPDVRVLTEVSRSVKQGKMTLHLSKPLLNDSERKDWEVVIGEKGKGFDYKKLEGEDPVIIKGGHPFLVRGFIPEIWNSKINNMGMYIMAVAASDNKVAALEGKSEQELPYQFNAECFDEHNIPLPCVKHHIHARNADQDPKVEGDEYAYVDAEKSKPACYHFIGTYSTTTIPQYAYYLGKSKSTGKHTFFRSTKATTSWNPYSAVIIGLNDPYYDPEDINKVGSVELQNILVEWNEPQSDLVVLPGENPALAGKPFSFVIDEEGKGEPTGIVDVNLKENVKVNNNKVYGINGQYIGTSLKNLPKGIYIINGQKFVVK